MFNVFLRKEYDKSPWPLIVCPIYDKAARGCKLHLSSCIISYKHTHTQSHYLCLFWGKALVLTANILETKMMAGASSLLEHCRNAWKHKEEKVKHVWEHHTKSEVPALPPDPKTQHMTQTLHTHTDSFRHFLLHTEEELQCVSTPGFFKTSPANRSK